LFCTITRSILIVWSCLVFYGTNPKATEVERQERHAVALSMIRTSWEFGSKLMAEALMPFGGAREEH